MSVFTKPAIDVKQQLELLKQRGLIVKNEPKALLFLESVSFFRLTPYMRPFQDSSVNHTFIEGAGFRELSRLYDFDRRLRLLVMDALERIEVAVRARICNMMSGYGSHWYMDNGYFNAQYNHKRLMDTVIKYQNDEKLSYHKECLQIDQVKSLDDSKKQSLKNKRKIENYARHYVTTYTEPANMPMWAVLEILTFGELSHFYKGLAKSSDKKRIAQSFGLNIPLMESWLHALTIVRNICAHHGRFWNRELGIKPAIPKNADMAWVEYLQKAQPHMRIAMVLAILHYFMQRVSPHTSWHNRLFELFDGFPELNLEAMGLPKNWREDGFWMVSK